MVLHGAGLRNASMRSAAACITLYAGYSIGVLFYTRDSYVMSETYYDTVLGMYDIRH